MVQTSLAIAYRASRGWRLSIVTASHRYSLRIAPVNYSEGFPHRPAPRYTTSTMEGAASAKVPFRNLDQGSGATLDRRDPETPLVGTWGCISCVGVYFNIDNDRCFVAHINACSAITHPGNEVTNRGGKEIQDQVVRRMCAFVEAHNWNVHDPEFGTHLKLICPQYFNDENYQLVGEYVVRGIKQFFEWCATALEKERKCRSDPDDAKATELTKKAESLRSEAKDVRVHTEFHGMVVDPLTCKRTGLTVVGTGDPNAARDLGNYIAVDDKTLNTANCAFISVEDDPDMFPEELWAEREANQDLIQGYHKLKQHFRHLNGDLDSLTKLILTNLSQLSLVPSQKFTVKAAPGPSHSTKPGESQAESSGSGGKKPEKKGSVPGPKVVAGTSHPNPLASNPPQAKSGAKTSEKKTKDTSKSSGSKDTRRSHRSGDDGKKGLREKLKDIDCSIQ